MSKTQEKQTQGVNISQEDYAAFQAFQREKQEQAEKAQAEVAARERAKADKIRKLGHNARVITPTETCGMISIALSEYGGKDQVVIQRVTDSDDAYKMRFIGRLAQNMSIQVANPEEARAVARAIGQELINFADTL